MSDPTAEQLAFAERLSSTEMVQLIVERDASLAADSAAIQSELAEIQRSYVELMGELDGAKARADTWQRRAQVYQQAAEFSELGAKTAEAESATLRRQLEDTMRERDTFRADYIRVVDRLEAMQEDLDDARTGWDRTAAALREQDAKLTEARALLAPLLELEAKAVLNRRPWRFWPLTKRFEVISGEGFHVCQTAISETAALIVAAVNAIPDLRAALSASTKEPP